jgi:ribA/ribD-fused uncharacterized protein
MPVKHIGEVMFFFGYDTPLSNFYSRSFVVRDITFFCLEQAFMYSKAMVFRDFETAALILKQTDPKECKRLGRTVRGFNDRAWNERKVNIVYSLCKEKFKQNIALKTFLLSTAGYELVEANPNDAIWGIGVGLDDKHLGNRSFWKGQNLLGIILMKVREELRQEQGG